MHQIAATEGVIWLTILGTFLLRGSITELHEAWAHSALMRGMHLLLSNTPFFPVQIAAGAYLGHKLYRRWEHRSAHREGKTTARGFSSTPGGHCSVGWVSDAEPVYYSGPPYHRVHPCYLPKGRSLTAQC